MLIEWQAGYDGHTLRCERARAFSPQVTQTCNYFHHASLESCEKLKKMEEKEGTRCLTDDNIVYACCCWVRCNSIRQRDTYILLQLCKITMSPRASWFSYSTVLILVITYAVLGKHRSAVNESSLQETVHPKMKFLSLFSLRKPYNSFVCQKYQSRFKCHEGQQIKCCQLRSMETSLRLFGKKVAKCR